MQSTLNFKFDLKALSNREFEGYGSTFGNVDLGDDVVLPGAFKESLAAHEADGLPPQMFWMHNPEQVPGKWMAMAEDKKGLYVKGLLADTQLGNEMQTLLNMKAVRGLSIGFRIEDRQKDISYNEDGTRLLHKIDLWEVSLVSLAMNPLARVTASKSRLSHEGEYVPHARELEKTLRDVGMSQLVAKRIISMMKQIDDGIRDVDRTRDVDVDELAALEAIARLTDKVGAATVRR